MENLYVYNDGGKEASDLDRNNCAVRAIALALDKPYYEIKEQFKRVGRLEGRGSSLSMIRSVLGAYGFGVGEPSFKWTLNAFLKGHPTGVYILISRNHALTIKNGVVFDIFAPRLKTRIKFVVTIM